MDDWQARALKAEARVTELEAALRDGLAILREMRAAREAVFGTVVEIREEMAAKQRSRIHIVK
jgi:transcription elongation GreA/GreB family factor